MNYYMGPDSFAIVPSMDLPCSRLPFRIHQNVCSALDPSDRWKDLVAAKHPDNPLLDIDSEKVMWLDNKHRGKGQSCTSALLEHLWLTKRMTAGTFLDLLERLKFAVDLTPCLKKYLDREISEEECARSTSACHLDEDPRKPVSKVS